MTYCSTLFLISPTEFGRKSQSFDPVCHVHGEASSKCPAETGEGLSAVGGVFALFDAGQA